MHWKRFCLVLMALVATQTILKLQAQEQISTDSIRLVRAGDYVQLIMRVDFDRRQVGNDEVLLVEPMLASQADSASLPSVGVYGRNTYYYQARDGKTQIQETDGIKLRAKNSAMPIIYAAILPYQPWMDFASVHVRITKDRLCEGTIQMVRTNLLTAQPQLVETPTVIETIRGTVDKKAYVDFIVNRTEIRPDYHDNRNELKKIENTIDSVRNDPTAKILGISIKGWASPEGPYDNNVRLAKGRSRSLRQYMIDHYGIDPAMITSTYEPEDWEGLREYVEQSDLPHRKEMLIIIDTDEEPDAKLQRIKDYFPKEYSHILKNVMPYLRHSDYRIDYERFRESIIPGRTDSLWALPTTEQPLMSSPKGFKPFHPDFALKTNLLFDAAAALNFELEVPFGKERRWSVMVEDWFPWYVWRHNSRAYEVWNVGAELRRWFGQCPGKYPVLTGTFAGIYAAGGKYDVEWNSKGYQGEFGSFGATIGHSWVLSRRWNFEASMSVGVVFGPCRHYHGEFGDSHLIWKYNDNLFYAGPTKLKLSLVWLLENPFKKGKKIALFDKKRRTSAKKEGGAR